MDYNECLRKGKIKKFSRGKKLVLKELNSAESDLKIAEISAQNKNYKWATVQIYYAMFHTARALLYNKNLREHSHFCLILSMIELYVNTKMIPVSIIEAMKEAKNLREEADYYDRWSEEGYKKLVDKAKEFIERARKIIEKEK